MRAALALTAAVMAVLALPAEARTKGFGPHLHKMHIRAPRPHIRHAPHSTFRTVRVRRADGTVLNGYRDSFGTHLTGPNGRTVHCRRQLGAADIEIACH